MFTAVLELRSEYIPPVELSAMLPTRDDMTAVRRCGAVSTFFKECLCQEKRSERVDCEDLAEVGEGHFIQGVGLMWKHNARDTQKRVKWAVPKFLFEGFYIIRR